MAKVSAALITQLAEANYWYSDISRYLTLIQLHKVVELINPKDGAPITLDPDQAWEFVSKWADHHNFSLNARRSRRSQINDLLSDIANRQKLESEAASSLNALKQKAREGIIPDAAKAGVSANLLNAEKLQREQIAALEKKLFDPLTTYYLSSPLLSEIKDPGLKLRAATVLAANPQLVALYNPNNATAGRPHVSYATNQIQTVLSRSIPQLTPFFATLRSDDVELATAQTLAGAHQQLSTIYVGSQPDSIDVGALQADLHRFQQATHIGNTLSDISAIVQSLPDTYLSKDISGIDHTLHQIIAEASIGNHISGQAILNELASRHQLTAEALARLSFLAPRLELAEIALRTELAGDSLLDNTRHPERFSAGLAARAGLNPSIFWLKDEDLASATKHYLGKYGPLGIGVTNLDEAIEHVLSQPTPDLDAYYTLSTLKDQTLQRKRYHEFRAHDTLFYLQDNLTQLNYRFSFIKEPYTKVSRRVWGHIDKIDDILHYPQRRLSDFLDELADGRAKIGGRTIKTVFNVKLPFSGRRVNLPIFRLREFLFDQYKIWQTNLAQKVFAWSWKLGQRGGLFTPLKRVANYTLGFIQHGADFRETNFYFFRKSVGNFLDWGAKKLGHVSFTAWKTAVKDAAIVVGDKLTKGLVTKALAYLTSIGLSVEGIGLFTTAVMLAVDLIKAVGGFFKKLIKDADFRDKILNIVPIIGGFFASAGVFIAGLPAFALFGLSTFFTAIGTLLAGLAGLLIPALLWGLGIIAVVTLFYNMAIQTIPGLDVKYDPPASAANLGAASGCKDQQIPAPAGAGIPTRASEIVADLHGGFWGYCNRPTNPLKTGPNSDYSAQFPVQDEPKNKTVYSKSYRPDLFDYELYSTTTFKGTDPTREQLQTSGNALYWCTYLVQHSYRESGKSGFSTSLWSPTLEDEFRASHTFIEGRDANSSKVKPGDIVFFKTDGGPNRTNHVGVVNSVMTQGFSYYQSNAPTINGNGTFDGSGASAEPGIMVVGFGRLK